jgi:hypothetical protein
MRIVGILSFYNDGDFLPAVIKHLSEICTELIAIDGPYRRVLEMNPQLKEYSTDGSLEVIENTVLPIDKTIIRGRVWENQLEKRNYCLSFLREGDWFLIADADEIFYLEDEEKLKSILKEEYSIAVSFPFYSLSEDSVYLEGYWHPRLFKFLEGMHYEMTHWKLCDKWSRLVEATYPVLLTSCIKVAHLKGLKLREKLEKWQQYQDLMYRRGFLE